MDVCQSTKYGNNEKETYTPNQLQTSVTQLHNENDTQSTEIISNNDGVKYNSNKLNSAIWTSYATSTLVKLYEAKLEMLETPKKKTRIWIAISDNLKDYNIDVTPDQVRWKINALTKKYKHCINIGKHEKFKYFKEMDSIYAKYNVDCDSYSITEHLLKKKMNDDVKDDSILTKPITESRAVIEMRKARLAKRIESDRFQGKIKLERQWLEYLHKQEEQTQWMDKVYDRNLKIREEKLETRKRELELKETIEYRQLEQIEKKQEELLLMEREKCELLKQMFCHND